MVCMVFLMKLCLLFFMMLYMNWMEIDSLKVILWFFYFLFMEFVVIWLSECMFVLKKLVFYLKFVFLYILLYFIFGSFFVVLFWDSLMYVYGIIVIISLILWVLLYWSMLFFGFFCVCGMMFCISICLVLNFWGIVFMKNWFKMKGYLYWKKV